jgi:hypothetical protein
MQKGVLVVNMDHCRPQKLLDLCMLKIKLCLLNYDGGLQDGRHVLKWRTI